MATLVAGPRTWAQIAKTGLPQSAPAATKKEEPVATPAESTIFDEFAAPLEFPTLEDRQEEDDMAKMLIANSMADKKDWLFVKA